MYTKLYDVLGLPCLECLSFHDLDDLHEITKIGLGIDTENPLGPEQKRGRGPELNLLLHLDIKSTTQY